MDRCEGNLVNLYLLALIPVKMLFFILTIFILGLSGSLSSINSPLHNLLAYILSVSISKSGIYIFIIFSNVITLAAVFLNPSTVMVLTVWPNFNDIL